MSNIFKVLKEHKNILTRQQYKTLKGQAIAGDITGAYKGLQKIKERRRQSYEKQNNAG